MIELIAEKEKDATAAEQLGAARVELVSAIQLGGLTPSLGTIYRTLKAVRIPVQVMIRPHNYGFVYDKNDKDVMKMDISTLQDLGHYRIVIGALDQNKKIDTEFLDDLFNEFPELDVTFHRAFDEADDLFEAYRVLVPYRKNIKRVLTSGGERTCIEAIESLHKLVQLQNDLNGPRILPGAGINHNNINELHRKVEAHEYHFGSGVREDLSFEMGFNREAIRAIKTAIS